MSWSETREKILDAATRALLAEIPIVGGFAANLWETIEADESGKAEQLASLLESAARQEHEFKKLQALIEEQGETLLATRASTEDILRRVVGIDQKVEDLSVRL